MTSRGMTARLTTTRTTEIWYVSPIGSSPDPSYSKEKDAVDVPATDEDDEFIVESEDMSPAHAEIKRMIESPFHVFQEAILNHRIEAMIETKVVSLLETFNHETARGEKMSVEQAVERVGHRVVARCAVIEVIHMKDDNLSELQDFIQHLTLTSIKNLSFTVPVTYLLEQHAQAPAVGETMLYDQSFARANQD